MESTISLASYDKESKMHKDVFTPDEKSQIVEKVFSDKDVSKELDQAVDKILISHRNTKIFLFMMTGPFLVIFQLTKYIIKYGTLYYFYLQAKKLKE